MTEKKGRQCLSAAVICAVWLTCACRGGCREEANTSAEDTNGKNDEPVYSLLQLIVRPDEFDGKHVDLGAYIVLDREHRMGFVEYGLNHDDGEVHIIDNSPIGFELDSLACRNGSEKAGVLVENDILRIFSTRKAAYGFVQGTFEKDAHPFEGGRICDVTGMRLFSDSVRDEKE